MEEILDFIIKITQKTSRYQLEIDARKYLSLSNEYCKHVLYFMIMNRFRRIVAIGLSDWSICHSRVLVENMIDMHGS